MTFACAPDATLVATLCAFQPCIGGDAHSSSSTANERSASTSPSCVATRFVPVATRAPALGDVRLSVTAGSQPSQCACTLNQVSSARSCEPTTTSSSPEVSTESEISTLAFGVAYPPAPCTARVPQSRGPSTATRTL